MKVFSLEQILISIFDYTAGIYILLVQRLQLIYARIDLKSIAHTRCNRATVARSLINTGSEWEKSADSLYVRKSALIIRQTQFRVLQRSRDRETQARNDLCVALRVFLIYEQTDRVQVLRLYLYFQCASHYNFCAICVIASCKHAYVYPRSNGRVAATIARRRSHRVSPANHFESLASVLAYYSSSRNLWNLFPH